MRVLRHLFPAILSCAALCRGESDTTALPDAPRHAGARVLRGGDLTVEVMDPAAERPYYSGIRFSPVANVLRVTMDGRDFLFSPVEHDATKENAGLAMEFDLKQWSDGGPPGFAEAGEGGEFLKVGVGVLRRTGVEYGFYKPYEVVSLAPTTATWAADRATFLQVCTGTGGLAYELAAEVRVRDRVVEIEYRLRNTGARPLATEHYAHNFFAFDDAVGGPGYEVEFPRDFSLAQINKPGLLAKDGPRLSFPAPIPAGKAVNATIMLTPAETPAVSGPEAVIVRHAAGGLSVRAAVSRPTDHVVIHASPLYVCAEQFVRLRLAPGEDARWTRTYEFTVDTR